MESNDDLIGKIKDFSSQLQEVNKCLESDSENEQLLKIQEDLRKVINLHMDLLQLQSDDTNPSASDMARKNATDESDENDDDDDDSENEQSAFVTTATTPRALLTGKIKVGEVVEVIGGDRLFAGVVTDFLESTGDYRVKYYEYEAEVTLPPSNLSRIAQGPVTLNDVTVGMKGQCKYATDQQYYDAVITAITQHGIVVKYTQYGNSEEAPVDYFRPMAQKQKKVPNQNTLIKIPENLKILPTDTEEEKMRKKKRIKAIKSKNRIVTKEVESAVVAQNWKKFVTKAAKKPGVGKMSMFASPETIEGKVGVTNSGKGLTDFADRKKHK